MLDAEFLTKLKDLLLPVLEFHQPSDADSDDVRMYWDVRLVRGNDEKLVHVTGTSSLSCLLGEKMIAESPSIILREIEAKIATPVSAKIQAIADQCVKDSLPPLTGQELVSIGMEPASAADATDDFATHTDDDDE